MVAQLHVGVLTLALVVVPAASARPRAQGPSNGRQHVIVGGDRFYPPYEWLDEQGHPAGFHVDLLRAIADLGEFDVQFSLKPWSEALDALRLGDIDVLPMFADPELDSIFDFSDAITTLTHDVFVRMGDAPVESLEALRGRAVVVQRGALAHRELERRGMKDLALVETEADALLRVAAGQYEAALITRVGAALAQQLHNVHNVIGSGQPLLVRQYVLAVRGNDSTLLGALNDGLAVLGVTGQYQVIYERWFREPTSARGPIDWAADRPLALLAVLIALASGSLAWWWSLQRVVRVRTQTLQGELADHRRAEETLQLRSEELARSRADLERFNQLAVGREQRMIQMKREVNALAQELGRPPPYDPPAPEPRADPPE